MDVGLVIFILLFLLAVTVVYIVYVLIDDGRKKRDIQRILNTRVFLMTIPKEMPSQEPNSNEPPKDFRQLIGVAEQLFASLASLYSANVTNRLLRNQEQISFEIVAQDGLISFYVACPKMIEEMVEKQLQGYYPTAHLERVASPNIFKLPNNQGEYAVTEMKLAKKFILPIKTYPNLESDPLAGITNAMSKLGDGSTAAVQMIIKPTGDEWRRLAITASKKIQEGKTYVAFDKWYVKLAWGFFDIIGEIFSNAGKKPNQPDQAQMDKNAYKPMNPIQENILKALNEKTSKNGFETAIRIVTTGPNAIDARTHMQGIVAAFSQFGTPELNKFEIKVGGGEMVKDYILRRFNEKGLVLNTEELATIYHFPNHYIDTPNIRWLMSKEMPPPANLPAEGCVMGKSVYRGVETMVRITVPDRQKHLFMIGKTGTGKTTLFTNMMQQDIQEGRGCCYIDPNGDAIETFLGIIPPHRMKDVVIFDASDTEFPMGLNMMEFKSQEQKDFIIQECIEIFYKLFDPNRTGMVGPQWEHWFRNAALTIMSQPGGGTLIDIPRLFTDDAFRAKLESYVTDPLVKKFWTEQLAKTADFHKSEMYNYFISKFGRFMTNDLMRNIIGQKQSAFDVREVMDTGKILLINLSKGKIGEINSNLLGMVLVARIQMAAFSRADIPEDDRKDFYLYVDEFQNFTTDNFRTILSEARKYHLDLSVTTQYIAQLTESIRDAVIGNAGTLVIYRIGAADAEFMMKELPGVSVADMTNLDKFNTYVKLLIDGTPSKPFSMKGIKYPNEPSEEVRQQVKNLSRQAFAMPRAQVEKDFAATMVTETPATPPPAGSNGPLNNL